MQPKVVLSIAGSDSSGGAGVQADLKSFSFLGVYGVSVVTCVTAQNSQQVKSIHKMPVEMVEQQVDAVFEDFSVSGVKTGMLYDAEIIECVTRKFEEYHVKPVVDPVMVATSGGVLSDESYLQAFQQHLLPRSFLLAANVPEAYKLTRRKITSIDEMKTACEFLFGCGAQHILIKGGHLRGQDAVDVFFDGKTFYEFSLPRIPDKKAHGSGCTLSALITGLLALGKPPVEAVKTAKYMTWGMIHEGYQLGGGADVLCHSCTQVPPVVISDKSCFSVWLSLSKAVNALVSLLPSGVIPEVGMNFAYALPRATTLDKVCAVNGRILQGKDRVVVCGNLDFGCSKHVASVVLAAMSCDSKMRSALNLRYSEETIKRCRDLGFRLGLFDRRQEPDEAGSTMEWGTKQAIRSLDSVPDLVYDTGGMGKEPMIRVLGATPDEVVSKVRRIFSK